MQEMGTVFLQSLPTKITKTEHGKLQVWEPDLFSQCFIFQVDFSNGVPTEEFDTVLYATGRRPDTKGLNLEAVGTKYITLVRRFNRFIYI